MDYFTLGLRATIPIGSVFLLIWSQLTAGNEGVPEVSAVAIFTTALCAFALELCAAPAPHVSGGEVMVLQSVQIAGNATPTYCGGGPSVTWPTARRRGDVSVHISLLEPEDGPEITAAPTPLLTPTGAPRVTLSAASQPVIQVEHGPPEGITMNMESAA